MSDSLWQRLRNGVRRLRQHADWEQFVGIDWAERIMGVTVTDRFHAKQGRSTGRWIIECPGGRLAVYLKRHYRLPWWQGLLATLCPARGWSPAMQEWQHLEWARAEGFLVPRAVAASESIGPWGKFQSCLAVEELHDMLPLHEAIPEAAARLAPAAFRQWKAALVAELARQVRALHSRRHFHKDLYLCHFYILREDTARLPDWSGRVYMIDLHRLGHHAWTAPIWQVKDLAQLLYSTAVSGITDRDRLAFWRHYGGAGRKGRLGSWLRRLVVAKARRYHYHNSPRQAATPTGRGAGTRAA